MSGSLDREQQIQQWSVPQGLHGPRDRSQSLSCAVRAGFMQIAIGDGAALLHAASARPSTSSGVGVKTAFSVLDCACAAGAQRLATHRPVAIATENGRGIMPATILVDISSS